MELFEFKNNEVVIHPAAYTLTTIKKLTKGKNAIKELAFVFFFADYKSDFSDIFDDDEKTQEIKKLVSLPPTWKASQNVLDAIEFYKERQQTPSMRLLNSTMSFVNKLDLFYKDIDLNERDPQSNKLLHNVSQLQAGAANIGNLTKSIKEIRAAIAKEIDEAARVRGGQAISVFEDPNV